MAATESQLQEQVASYIARKYPRVMFHSDFGSGVKLTPQQAVRQKRQNAGRRAWPDLFIAESSNRCVDGSWDFEWHGLFIELKREGSRLKKKNGEYYSQHIAEQAAVLDQLEEKGYFARFAVGFEEAKKLIDDYLGGLIDEDHESSVF